MKNPFIPFNSRTAAVVMAGGLALAGSALAYDLSADKNTRPTVNLPLDETAVPRDTLPRGSYSSIVKKVAPAVVKIEISKIDRVQAPQFPGANDPFWQQFFGPGFGRMQPQESTHVEHGLGSGVIVTANGYILTNNHVVDGAKEVKVTLTDGREFTAKVIGRDPKSDIAIVKINATDLPIVNLADSEKVQVGDVVLAIGNPFGVGQTVTSGIVSATDRGNMGIEDYEDFIQTDAAINPGNSGGALVDIDGRLIGINTAILSRSGGSQGLGFAIPSNLVRTEMASIIQTGHVLHGYIGVMIQNVTPDLAGDFKLKDAAGALISDVSADGPAAKGGMKDGDVVVKFNGHDVTDSRHLQLEVGQTPPGTKVPVVVIRDGDQKTLDLTVDAPPGTDQVADAGNPDDTGTLNGVGVGDLDPSVRDQFHLPDSLKGAVVTQVDPASPAAEAGLKPGSVIEEINHHPVASADEAVKLTQNPGSKKTLLRIWQDGGSHYLVVDESANG